MIEPRKKSFLTEGFRVAEKEMTFFPNTCKWLYDGLKTMINAYRKLMRQATGHHMLHTPFLVRSVKLSGIVPWLYIPRRAPQSVDCPWLPFSCTITLHVASALRDIVTV